MAQSMPPSTGLRRAAATITTTIAAKTQVERRPCSPIFYKAPRRARIALSPPAALHEPEQLPFADLPLAVGFPAGKAGFARQLYTDSGSTKAVASFWAAGGVASLPRSPALT